MVREKNQESKRKEAYLVDGRILFVKLKMLRPYGESINISALILMRGRSWRAFDGAFGHG